MNAITIYKKRSLAVVPHSRSRHAQIMSSITHMICRTSCFVLANERLAEAIGGSAAAADELLFQTINQELNYKKAHPLRYLWQRILGNTLMPSPLKIKLRLIKK
jgi:hypothetical protein